MTDKFMADDELDKIAESLTNVTIVTKTGMSLKHTNIYFYTNIAICVFRGGIGLYTIPWRNIDYIIEESE